MDEPQTDLYTSGPWEVLPLSGKLDDWTGSAIVIRAKGAPGGLCIIMGGLGSKEEMANAHLIATATELLGLARGYVRFLETHPGDLNEMILEQVRPIIAKATGSAEASDAKA